MIKNTFIVLLTLVVVGLSWMTLSDTEDKQEVISKIQDKSAQLQRHINTAYVAARDATKDDPVRVPIKAAIQKAEGARSEGKDNKKEKEKEGANKPVIVKNTDIARKSDKLETQDNKKQTPEQSVSDILGGIKKGLKNKKDSLTTEDVNSIMSILKSAQDILKKTAFGIKPVKEGTPTRNRGPQASTIKKKSSDGPGELG